MGDIRGLKGGRKMIRGWGDFVARPEPITREGQRTGSSRIFDVALLCPGPCWSGATKGADADFSPQLWEALTRGFLMQKGASFESQMTRRA